MIAVKHGRRKGFRLIRDRLTYGRRIPWRTSKREIKRGRGITWELRAMPAPGWVVEQWPGSATIIAVRSHGTREGKPQDETRYYVTRWRTGAKALLKAIRQRWSITEGIAALAHDIKGCSSCWAGDEPRGRTQDDF